MQRCQKCGRTYQDDKQKFCTFDGGRLEIDSDGAPTVMDLNKTMQANLPPPPGQGVTAPIAPPVPDMNRTVAGDSPVTTSEFQGHVTGPTQSPTSSPLQPPVSAPLPPAQQPSSSAPLAQPFAQPTKKSSKLPLIIGSVAALLLLGLGAGGFLLWFLTSKSEKPGSGGTTINANPGGKANTNTSANANDNATTDNANTGTAPAAPPNSAQFVNSRQNLNSLLAQHYKEFSFYYPRAWTINTQAGTEGSTNFVKVERLMPPNFTQEEFAVSYYDSKGTLETDKDVFPVLIEKLNSKFSAGYPEYRKISEGETKINGIKGYEFRYEGMSRGTAKGDINLWGRVIFLPPGVEGDKNGVTLLIFTTSIAPELKTIEDVGVRGELPVILNSFKLGQ